MENNNEKEDGRRPVNITTTPLWKYVTIIRDSVDGGGNKVWKCNFCSKQVIGSYYKVKGHLLHLSGRGTTACTKVNNELKEELNHEEDGALLNKLTSKVEEQQRPIVNIMGASGTSAVFIDSVDASGKRKDAAFVSEVFIKAIEEVGAENVVQVVTDNEPNFKAAGSIVEAKYPRIFWTPCVVHCVNLAFKSICEPPEKSDHFDQCIWLKNLCTNVKEIQKFVTTHDIVKSIFTKHTNLQLLSVAETRFASHYVVAERMKEVKEGLEKMVMDSDFRVLFRTTKNPIDIKAREYKERILNDSWWDNLDYFLKFAEPIYEMIRVGDKDAPVLHLVYDMWDTMIERVKVHVFHHEGKDILADTSEFFDAIHKVLESRWNKSSTPLHCLAHSLVPRFYSTRWLKGSTSGFARVSPNEDEEVSNNRNDCFRRLFPNSDDFKHVRLEYGAFSSETPPFNQAHIIAARDDEEPIVWWANYGSSLPHLQSLAFKLLSQPASSSCCERNWSHYDNIQTIKRNRLTSERAKDLVYCHNNLRVMARKEESYKSGPSRYWDVEIHLMWMLMFARLLNSPSMNRSWNELLLVLEMP
ncbi:uncharacterized protein [Spinacia oleracea]|uniref:Uncharacterized protein isoform X2 n=1 Tax=Spinacia oleracea TaxID=3562 RepID=A0ABM3RM81_SPIOL|nr:uncharacterized protein LOC110777522 isoform X2 [Spinacia oleracea]XP_056696722.1 uncharacterized protein LOC130470505 isoform X2 [Spinacia oleracea]